METGTFTACDGTTISDNGGGAAYTDGNFTLTLCPETPGDVIQLDFSAFALQNPPGNNGDDFLAIFDGDDISAPSLGSYTGNALQGLQVTGTVNNTSGCLTLQFNDIGTANDTSPGFEASVTCTTPCDPPTVASAITSPLPEDPQVQSVGICANTSISFSGNGSFAAPGFTLAQYIWNFDDGTVDNTSGVNATHNFTEPGEYIVTLTVEDNNGCQSLNIIPLQVLVSTTPLFPGILSQETCYPEMVTLTAVLDSDPNDGGNDDGVLDVVSPTWTALPPQVVAGETYLADGAGFSYTTCLEFDFFEDGAVLENCEDLLSVFVNMEHSYMGDLGLFITCPDGTIVSLVEWGVNGGTGTFLGEALDDENTDPGIGYDYFWSPDATNGTWGENATGQGILPSGTYAAYGDLCDLEGCPLNGAWCFSVTDNIGADNGYIFAWGLNLNPALYPDVTTFTPIIGADADSSYWSGPGIIELSADADTAYVLPNAAGIYNYTYTVINNFGCQFDTTITVEWTEPLEVTAGPDQLYSCGAVQLEGGFVGMDAPSCGADAGIFNYCYDNNENFTWTFCPDDPGDGVTYMTFTFLAGDMEGFLEDFIVYDGDNTAAPVIEAWSNGDATGLSWTATNATGCLTISFSSDGSSSCGDGLQSEWTYEISCSGGGPVYTWEWSPIDFLDNPNIPGPNVNDITQNTIYTLVGYPVGHPTCFSSDDVLVSIDPLGDPGLDASITICSTDAPFSMLDELNGTPVSTGEWFDPNNNPLPDDTFDPAVNLPGVYTHSVAFGNCEAIAELTISMALPTQIEISDDTTVCEFSDVSFLLTNLNFGQDPFSYQWNYNGTPIGNSTTGGSFMPDMTGELCLNVTDACGYVATECMDVVVEPAVDVVFEADTLAQCWPLGFYLTSLVDPALYNSIYWSVGDSVVAQNTESLPLIFNEPGSYTIGLRVTNFLGCNYSATYDDYLISYNPPIAGFDPDPQPTDATQTEIFFSDESIGDIVEYQWLFGYPILGASTLSNPTFTFPLGVGNEYPVTLNVTDIHGCTDQVSGIVDINDIFQVYVPNTFTPNYDGINDVFFFEGADIDETRFFLKIFNRWGDVIFESTDINVPWTGDVHDGEHFAGDGIYNWIALVTSKSTGEKYELSGIVNIIR
jgi:gliding motility-associated-like protein